MKSVAPTKAEQSSVREETALSDLTEKYDLACMGEDQLEQLVRDGEITEEVADQIGQAVLFGDFREECISR